MMFFLSVSQRLQCLLITLCFLIVSHFIFADLSSETLYLTWQRQPDTTMTIQWISLCEEQDSSLYYRPVKSMEWQKVSGVIKNFPTSNQYLLHRVELIHLKPDTMYELTLTPNQENPYFFRTMPEGLTRPIRFVVGGDMYHDDKETKDMETTCRQASKTNPDFALLGGDIAYAVKSARSDEKLDRWIDWIRVWHKCMVTDDKRLIPVISAIGNHDLVGQFDQTPAQAKVFSLLFPMPGEQIYNVLDFGSYLSLVILDSGHANRVEGTQTKWLKSTMKSRRHVLHCFAIYHVPAYPSIRSFNNRKSVSVRKNWVPIFEREGLGFVFEHHDHAYKRTVPLLNNKTNPTGVVYIGDGAWSVDEPRQMTISKRSHYLAKFVPSRHFILMTVENNEEHMTSISADGKILDQYSIQVTPANIL